MDSLVYEDTKQDLISKCSSMSHEVYVWDIGVDSLKYIESVLLDILATIVNKIIDKEDYLMLLLTSELHLNQRTKFHEDFYCEFHPLKAGNHLQSKNLYI